jgi:hypothetical protein
LARFVYKQNMNMEIEELKKSVDFLSEMYEKQKEEIRKLKEDNDLKNKEIGYLKAENIKIKNDVKLLNLKCAEKEIKKIIS